MKTFVAISTLLAAALSAPVPDHGRVHAVHAPVHAVHAPVHAVHAPVHAPAYHAPVHAAPAYHAPAKHAPSYGHESYAETPAQYNYQYAVVDDYSGVNMGQNEARDGYSTYGEYHVQLPDGRLQTVKYNVADAYSGYVADVSYSGEPHYGPAPHKAAPHHAPAYAPAHPAPYHPAPAYKPAPVYH